MVGLVGLLGVFALRSYCHPIDCFHVIMHFYCSAFLFCSKCSLRLKALRMLSTIPKVLGLQMLNMHLPNCTQTIELVYQSICLGYCEHFGGMY